MDLFKLLDVLPEDKRLAIGDLVISELADELKPLGWALIRTEELQRLKNTTHVPKEKSNNGSGKRIEVTVHGRTYESVAQLSRVYNVNPQKLYKWLNEGVDLDEILPKPDDNFKLMAEEVDKNGIVTKIRKQENV